MFNSIFELPTQVRASLDEDDQKIFMEAYNKEDPKTKEEMSKAMRKAWHACEKLPSSFSFRTIAAMNSVDKMKEMLDVKAIKDIIDDYIDRGGNVQWEHANYNVGTIWDWEPVKKDGMEGIAVYGNLFGGDLVYDKMRKNFINGMNSLSVGGEAERGHYLCDEQGCYVRRNMRQLLEISLCAVPMNSYCKMEWYNDSVKKSADETRLPIVEYTIHKSYRECPTQALKKSLMSIYPEVHATLEGVFVPMTKSAFLRDSLKMRECGLRPIWTGKGAMVQSPEIMHELAFRKGLSEGFVTPDGYLTDSVTKSDFETLYGWGLLNEEFRLK